jgi:hypothetical protein
MLRRASQAFIHEVGNRDFLKLRDKSSRSRRRPTKTKADVETEDLEIREVGVGGRAPIGIGNRRIIVALILPGIRNRGKGEGAGETSFEDYVGL